MVEHVQGVGPLGGGEPAQGPRRAHPPHAPEPREPDAVEVSQELQALREAKDVRLEKVLDVRKALREGTYLTPEKLDLALDRAIDEAFGVQPPDKKE
ncbi:MAG: flagellar biosynthesis anti-sigma factor FlgM [Planctomycetota bacterium]